VLFSENFALNDGGVVYWKDSLMNCHSDTSISAGMENATHNYFI